jgi:hypothetical protein
MPGRELLYGLYSVTVTVKVFDWAALYPALPTCVAVIVDEPPPTGVSIVPAVFTEITFVFELAKVTNKPVDVFVSLITDFAPGVKGKSPESLVRF